ncbi:F-box/LRR-repeat protein 16 [Lamellibrachia satsuma]|nr:F-box/LRR-repeat protein 16 [Lamellibrachia satsuma]
MAPALGILERLSKRKETGVCGGRREDHATTNSLDLTDGPVHSRCNVAGSHLGSATGQPSPAGGSSSSAESRVDFFSGRASIDMSSISKACLEISNSIKGFRLSRAASTTPTEGGSTRESSSGGRAASSVTSTISRVIKSATSRMKGLPERADSPPSESLPVVTPERPSLPDIWQNEEILSVFFLYFPASDLCSLTQVCRLWRDVLYRPAYWRGATPVVDFRRWSKDDCDNEARHAFYRSLVKRGFDSMCLVGATDRDATDVAAWLLPACQGNVVSIGIRCSNISDAGLETVLDKLPAVHTLELSGCNEVTEAGLWTCLNARIVSLSISDCINVADDTVGAIAQLLPSLGQLNLQAYHVTDSALTFFSARQSCGLSVLRLQSCWEVTNHGVVNIVRSLPNLTVLSLSGCSKITDDGVELVAENLPKLRSLDLSWCPRITDAALEYVACDLGQLEELVLDRCSQISDIGVGYLSTMTSLRRLFLRWCTQIRDFGLQHVYTMKSLEVLSLADLLIPTPPDLSWKHSATLQLLREDYSFTYHPLSVAKYSFTAD